MQTKEQKLIDDSFLKTSGDFKIKIIKKKLSVDVKTKFPKKIFIVPDVNASVFYNSSFWSMFFPIRKNLEIGLGLVNSLNISEFKSVIAHELGHFSQKSTRLGSYVYTANKVIYNLVYDYDSWDEILLKWSQIEGLFGSFASITSWLVEAIRKILSKAYDIINLMYLG
jgi:Zn-dependent protease with chaperone function